MEWLSRTSLLLGEEGMEKLNRSHVLVTGLGGVGAYAAEMIARAGVGEMTIVDGDMIQASNRNRQLPALVSTEGRRKVEVMTHRLKDINPEIKLHSIDSFLKGPDFDALLENRFDYVVDAIDTLSPKVFLIACALRKKHRLVSSMGAGGKIDPEAVRIVDISKSYQCNLARMVRKRLGKLGVKEGFEVVFSPEVVDKNSVVPIEDGQNQRSIVGTISYMPAVFGIFTASHVIRELVK